jgi:tetraacyldisaccharide 4'-kinase
VILFRILALPFMPLYLLAIAIRNLMYRMKLYKSSRFDMPVICIGNLSTGGTGKTPHTEYLAGLLKQEMKVAVLSRGYGRKTHGFKQLMPGDSAADCGDEPVQIYQRFGGEIPVFVHEKRVQGILHLLESRPDTGTVLLDDAFQHRALSAGLNILLTDYSAPFWRDIPLPLGNLREFRCGAKRAQIVVVTKCPDQLSATQKQSIRDKIANYTSAQVVFSKIQYSEPLPWNHTAKQYKGARENIILLTGIANPKPLLNQVQQEGKVIKHLSFPDHYKFKQKDLKQICEIFSTFEGSTPVLVTTAKDAVRLSATDGVECIENIPVFVWQISVDFGEDKELFETIVLKYVRENKADSEVFE